MESFRQCGKWKFLHLRSAYFTVFNLGSISSSFLVASEKMMVSSQIIITANSLTMYSATLELVITVTGSNSKGIKITKLVRYEKLY